MSTVDVRLAILGQAAIFRLLPVFSGTTTTTPTLVAWESLTDAMTWAGVATAEWEAGAEVMSDKEMVSMVLISGVEDDDFEEARKAAKLTAFRRAAMTLLFAAIKADFGIRTRFNEIVPVAAPAEPVGTTAAQ